MLLSMITYLPAGPLRCCLTLGGFGARSDPLLQVDDLLPLHHDVLQPLVVGVEAVLQQLAERHRTAGEQHRGGG